MTHLAGYERVPFLGKQVSVTAFSIHRIASGRLGESWSLAMRWGQGCNSECFTARTGMNAMLAKPNGFGTISRHFDVDECHLAPVLVIVAGRRETLSKNPVM